MTRARSLYPFRSLALGALATVTHALAVGCSQTPVLTPVRSMDRPQDIAYLCLQLLPDGKSWKGAPLEKCAYEPTTLIPSNLDATYRLHAVITQVTRGELAVADLGNSPLDIATGTNQLVNVNPGLPGFNFLPVSTIPTDVVVHPDGRAVYVASGRDRRIDIIPSELLRGPIPSSLEGGGPVPWPHVDLAKEDGQPTRLAVGGDGDKIKRLYVVLPEAAGGTKLAVYDIAANAIVPPRLADIQLVTRTPDVVQVAQLGCGPTGTNAPWWYDYRPGDLKCGATTHAPAPPAPLPPVFTPATPHLTGVAVAGDYLYAGDDGETVVHVFDLRTGIESERLSVGGKIRRLSVSEPVADEVVGNNFWAIEACENNGWVGDGQDHSANTKVRDSLGGLCRAHRYLYGVVPDDFAGGDGALLVVDLPVKFTGITKSVRLGTYSHATETIDFAHASIQQPLGCDAPLLNPQRLPLGQYGLTGLNAVPARSVAFMRFDPPQGPLGGERYAARCVPVNDTSSITGDTNLDNSIRTVEQAWRGTDVASGVTPRRFRGTFAFVAMTNGSINVVDIDDYDSACRGPSAATSPTAPGTVVTGGFNGPSFDELPLRITAPQPAADNTSTTTEEFFNPVRRHHPRTGRFYTVDVLPTVVNFAASVKGTSIAFLPIEGTNTAATVNPQLIPIGSPGTTVSASFNPNEHIVPATDNPYAVTSESWTSTFEGPIPGFGTTAGSFHQDGANAIFEDEGGGFCSRGVEAFGDVKTHDILSIVDDLCDVASGECTQTVYDECNRTFTALDTTDLNQILPRTRDFVIGTATQGKLELVQHFELDKNRAIQAVDGVDTAAVKRCFPGLTKYTIRARDKWIVVGGATGYLHKVRPDATGKCFIDTTLPSTYHGRITELPPTTTVASVQANACLRFINPAWQWAIRSGTTVTQRDFQIAFTSRFNFTPLTLGGGNLPMSVAPVAKYVGGLDVLRWNQMSVIDADFRGLTIFGFDTSAKVIN